MALSQNTSRSQKNLVQVQNGETILNKQESIAFIKCSPVIEQVKQYFNPHFSAMNYGIVYIQAKSRDVMNFVNCEDFKSMIQNSFKNCYEKISACQGPLKKNASANTSACGAIMQKENCGDVFNAHKTNGCVTPLANLIRNPTKESCDEIDQDCFKYLAGSISATCEVEVKKCKNGGNNFPEVKSACSLIMGLNLQITPKMALSIPQYAAMNMQQASPMILENALGRTKRSDTHIDYAAIPTYGPVTNAMKKLLLVPKNKKRFKKLLTFVKAHSWLVQHDFLEESDEETNKMVQTFNQYKLHPPKKTTDGAITSKGIAKPKLESSNKITKHVVALSQKDLIGNG